jgi:spore germination cell wall hydrolase CwlJ-like protein
MATDDDIDVLARTVFGEARGEGEEGMQAVASVVMNRVRDPKWWGSTIKEVCLKPWQFSCWNKNDPNLPVLKAVTEENPYFAQAIGIATEAAAGTLEDNTNGATSYYDRRMPEPPDWAAGKTPCAQIGHHLFFNV